MPLAMIQLAMILRFDSATIERIKQIGEVRIDSNIAVASSETSEQVERSGEEVYNTKCQVCHNSGMNGAPKYASLEDWAPRIERGIDDLVMSRYCWKGWHACKRCLYGLFR